MRINPLVRVKTTAPFTQWINQILCPLNNEVLQFVDYINYFITPYIHIDSSSVIDSISALPPAYSSLIYNSFIDYSNNYFLTSDAANLMVEDYTGSGEDTQCLFLPRLRFREYVINTNVEHSIFYGTDWESSSQIGYYMSLCQIRPVDSQQYRTDYGSKSDYMFIPFSEGSYYLFENNNNRIDLFYASKAALTYGHRNIVSLDFWPSRYTYERLYATSEPGYSVYSFLPTAPSFTCNIVSVDGCLWNSKMKTALAELYYKTSDAVVAEELITDCRIELQQTKLQDYTTLFYNITSENGSFPENVLLEVY